MPFAAIANNSDRLALERSRADLRGEILLDPTEWRRKRTLVSALAEITGRVDPQCEGGDGNPGQSRLLSFVGQLDERAVHAIRHVHVSRRIARLDASLTAFAMRRLSEPYPCLIPDARYTRAAKVA
jgi:hypothetical protein